MKNNFIAISFALALLPGTAFGGPEPALPGVSIPLSSFVVIPPFLGGGQDVGSIPVFFLVTPPTTPGGFFMFRLVSGS